jgi:N-acetylglutamate synthase-like GNAT family acetyltransferase
MNGMSTLTLDRVNGGAARCVKPNAATRRRMPRHGDPRRSSQAIIRRGTVADAPAIHRLIVRHGDGHLLARTLSDLTEHASRFMVATVRGRIAGCAELAPLSSSVAEVRSFVLRKQSRGLGLGRLLIHELRGRARSQGFEQLCAFTHAPAYFARLDFATVAPASVPEKIAADCRHCPLFGTCGQHAMVMDLAPAESAETPFKFLPVL